MEHGYLEQSDSQVCVKRKSTKYPKWGEREFGILSVHEKKKVIEIRSQKQELSLSR